MKRVLKWLGLAIGVVIAVVAAAAAYVAVSPLPHYPVVKGDFPVEVTPERVARGKRSVEMLCAACHMDSATGGLTGKRMPDLPGQFGEAWSRNITAHPVKGIGSWTNGEIAYLLRTGVARDGRYTPPWMVKLPTDDELIAWIKHPERMRPGIAMPTWDGVIKDEEYTPLAGYVRTLASTAPAAPAPAQRQ